MLGRSELANSSLQRGHKSNIHNRDLTIKSHSKANFKTFQSETAQKRSASQTSRQSQLKKTPGLHENAESLTWRRKISISKSELCLRIDLRPPRWLNANGFRWYRGPEAGPPTHSCGQTEKERVGVCRLRNQRQWIRVWVCWLEFGLSFSSVGQLHLVEGWPIKTAHDRTCWQAASTARYIKLSALSLLVLAPSRRSPIFCILVKKWKDHFQNYWNLIVKNKFILVDNKVEYF